MSESEEDSARSQTSTRVHVAIRWRAARRGTAIDIDICACPPADAPRICLLFFAPFAALLGPPGQPGAAARNLPASRAVQPRWRSADRAVIMAPRSQQAAQAVPSLLSLPPEVLLHILASVPLTDR